MENKVNHRMDIMSLLIFYFLLSVLDKQNYVHPVVYAKSKIDVCTINLYNSYIIFLK